MADLYRLFRCNYWLTVCPGGLCIFYRRYFSGRISLRCETSYPLSPLADFLSHLDQRCLLRLVCDQRELLDELASRIPDRSWQGDRYRSFPGHVKPQHTLRDDAYDA